MGLQEKSKFVVGQVGIVLALISILIQIKWKGSLTYMAPISITIVLSCIVAYIVLHGDKKHTGEEIKLFLSFLICRACLSFAFSIFALNPNASILKRLYLTTWTLCLVIAFFGLLSIKERQDENETTRQSDIVEGLMCALFVALVQIDR